MKKSFRFLLKLILLCIAFLITAIASWGLYIHFSKPELPCFEAIKQDLIEVHKKADSMYQWVSFEDLPKELIQFSIDNPEKFYKQSTWIDVVESRINLTFWIKKLRDSHPRKDPNLYPDSTRTTLIHWIIGLRDYKELYLTKAPTPFISICHTHALHADLDYQWSKQQQIETYFNATPLLYLDKRGIYSISQFYFDKHPKDLTASESAIIKALKSYPTNFGTRLKEVEQIACELLKTHHIAQAEQLCEQLPEQVKQAATGKNEYADQYIINNKSK